MLWSSREGRVLTTKWYWIGPRVTHLRKNCLSPVVFRTAELRHHDVLVREGFSVRKEVVSPLKFSIKNHLDRHRRWNYAVNYPFIPVYTKSINTSISIYAQTQSATKKGVWALAEKLALKLSLFFSFQKRKGYVDISLNKSPARKREHPNKNPSKTTYPRNPRISKKEICTQTKACLWAFRRLQPGGWADHQHWS